MDMAFDICNTNLRTLFTSLDIHILHVVQSFPVCSYHEKPTEMRSVMLKILTSSSEF
jgi:hypothetical protein